LGQALRDILSGAGIDRHKCDGLMVSSYSLAPDNIISLAQIFDLSLDWLEQIQLGGASGLLGVRRAARAVENGDADIIACIGGDTYNPAIFSSLLANFSGFTTDAVMPYGSGGATLPFAMLTQQYMNDFGIAREDFGRLCILQRENALRYKQSMFQKSLTIDDYLAARPIAEPLGLFDCVMPCAGAEGLLVMRDHVAEELGIPYVVLKSSAEKHNSLNTMKSPLRFGWGDFIDDLFQSVGMDRSDINLVQAYDDYPVMVFLQLEELGFFDEGTASKHLSGRGFLRNGKEVSLNSSGGQLSSGQAGFAGGFMGVVEAVRQLTDTALGNQLQSVDRALVSGFGMINYDKGLCTTAAILERCGA